MLYLLKRLDLTWNQPASGVEQHAYLPIVSSNLLVVEFCHGYSFYMGSSSSSIIVKTMHNFSTSHVSHCSVHYTLFHFLCPLLMVYPVYIDIIFPWQIADLLVSTCEDQIVMRWDNVIHIVGFALLERCLNIAIEGGLQHFSKAFFTTSHQAT